MRRDGELQDCADSDEEDASSDSHALGVPCHVRAQTRHAVGFLSMTATLTDAYDLPQEFKDFRDTIRQIARERVGEQDLMGLPFSEEHGGTGTGTLMLNVAIEEIAKACASSALILMVQELGTLPIALFGSDELKQRFLPRCASGEWTPAFCLSEPEAGSDPASMRTHAVRDGDEWVINGTKNWISNASIADFYVVFAMTDREARRSTAF